MAAAPRITISTEWSARADEESMPTEPVPKSRRPKGMTHAKLCERIQLGHGTGHGAHYLPWLTLRRKNVSPHSNQVVSWMPPLGRTAHYFSRGEYHTALLLLWLGVTDLREQFPLWPAPHPHPLHGSPVQPNTPLTWSKGLLAISEEASIAHGVEVGTRVPYVASLDLLATVVLPSRIALAAFSSKPIRDVGTSVSWRTRERLELERRYAEDVGSSYFVSHSALIPCLTAGQLETWIDASTLHCAARLTRHAGWFAEFINANTAAPINESVAGAADALMLSLDDCWLLFRHCCWTQAIDIDPSTRILTSRPVVKGGHRLRDRLRKQLFGETWT